MTFFQFLSTYICLNKIINIIGSVLFLVRKAKNLKDERMSRVMENNCLYTETRGSILVNHLTNQRLSFQLTLMV